MKHNFTLLCLTVFFVSVFSTAFSQSLGDFRSVNAPKSGTGGNWTDITKWERYDGASWIAAVAYPTSADGVITISANDSILLDADVTADQITVAADAVLAVSISTFDLTLNNGAGDDLIVNGTLYLRALDLINGPGNIVVNGIFNWYSGSLVAPTTTAIGSVTNLDLDFSKNLNSNFTNNGTFNWIRGLTAGGINFNNATFTNNGTINELFLADGGFISASGTNAFVNNGIFNKTTNFIFYNNSLPSTNSVTGSLSGKGSFVFNFGTLTNNGIVAPGSSPGLLNINAGAISGQSTTINIETLNNSGAGTGHDQLNLTTTGPFTTNLSTVTLNVTDIGPAPLQSYTILTTTGDFSGTFATANIPSGFSLTYNSTSVVLNKLSFPLPAVWGEFAAARSGNSVKLNWKTLQENNTSQFAVQYSTDGRKYSNLGTIPAKGNSGLTSNYSFTHELPLQTGNNFYRIQLTDLDGKTDYSVIRVVSFNNQNNKRIVIMPNPVRDILQLITDENVEVKLTDMNGRIVKVQTLTKGTNRIEVNSLKPGLYTIGTYKNNQLVETQVMVKQ
ncbi:MAG: T9SS type A sorting domain-containing protein [Lacibacter sp.]